MCYVARSAAEQAPYGGGACTLLLAERRMYLHEPTRHESVEIFGAHSHILCLWTVGTTDTHLAGASACLRHPSATVQTEMITSNIFDCLHLCDGTYHITTPTDAATMYHTLVMCGYGVRLPCKSLLTLLQRRRSGCSGSTLAVYWVSTHATH
jgi:hypothetical protein